MINPNGFGVNTQMEVFHENFIACQLKRICEAREVSVKKLSEELKMPYQTLLNYSNGSREPKWDFLKTLHEFGINLDWFVTGEGGMYRTNRVSEIREPPSVYGKGATVVTTGVNNGHIVTAGSQSRRESGMSRESLLCVFISEFATTHDADDLVWLEKQFERVVPEYRDWRNGFK